MYKVDAVVVTYNRLDLLKRCLNAIMNQTYPVNKILVVNNNSTDGTSDYLNYISSKYSFVKPISLEKNIGGAGGFNEGIKEFIKNSHDSYVWVMDDDTIPSNDALEKIMIKINPKLNFGFLCSNVRWKDGHVSKMNIPDPATDWNELASKGLIKINSTSFVSVLFPRKVIIRYGLPIKEYFIWGDDVEFTRRVTQDELNGYMVANSLVEHEIKKNIGSDIVSEEDSNRIRRYYLARRNTIFTMKKRYPRKELVKWTMRSLLINPIKIMLKSPNKKVLRIRYEIGGTLSGFFFRPKIQKFVLRKKGKIIFIMNKHAYLIIANKNQKQLQKLINTIDDSRNDIYLLIDKKSIRNFTQKFWVQYSDLNILKPINIFWGNYSQIQAELNLFDAAHYGHYEYYHLLSGSDLPLTNQDEIHNFFDNHPNKEFITYSAINDANQLSIRLHNYRFTKNFRSSNKLYNLVHKCEFRYFKNKPEKRVILSDIAFGSQWVSLEDNLVNDLLRNNDQIFYLFHNGYLVDELMIPIFINLHTKYKKKIFFKEPVHDKPEEFQGNLRYINWWDGSPYVWRLKDYPLLRKAYNNGHLFSRKFDETIDNDIIDKIVKKVLE